MIVIVDDESPIVELLRVSLARDGFTAEQAADGEAAVRRAHPDLVVLALVLPRINGWEVCRRIRGAGTTPILRLTAPDEEPDTLRGRELGADDDVTNPFGPREAVARIWTVLRPAGAGRGAPGLRGRDHDRPAGARGCVRWTARGTDPDGASAVGDACQPPEPGSRTHAAARRGTGARVCGTGACGRYAHQHFARQTGAGPHKADPSAVRRWHRTPVLRRGGPTCGACGPS